MSKRTSTGKTKDTAPARDGPESRPASRPTGRLVARPPCRLVSRPESASSGRGGRGGSRSASGNGDRLVDEGDYLDESRRPEGRPPNPPRYQHRDRPTCHLVSRPKSTSLGRGGRGGSSSTSGNGDQFADDRGDVGEFLDGSFRPEGRTARRGGGSSATREGDQCADDHGEYLDENMDELEMESSQHRRGSNIADTPPAQSSLRSWIYPYQNGFTEPRVHRQITAIFKYSFDGPWATWREVPKRDIQFMWERFKELYQWDARVEALVEKIFKDYLSKRFSDVMRECRLEAERRANDAGTPLVDQDFTILKPYNPNWIEPEDWSDMIDRVWNTVEWKKKSKAGRVNRSTLVDGQVSKHTAGSIRIDQHRLRMEKERGGPVSSLEVYQRCYTKKDSVSEYITTRAKNVAEKYSELMEEKYGIDRTLHPRVGDREIWERACGGPSKKGRFFGFGTPMDLDLTLTGTPSTGSSYAHDSGITSSNEVENLKLQLEDQAKAAQERELTAKKQQEAAEEREKAAEERVKELEQQVKEIAKMLKTLKPPPSPPTS